MPLPQSTCLQKQKESEEDKTVQYLNELLFLAVRLRWVQHGAVGSGWQGWPQVRWANMSMIHGEFTSTYLFFYCILIEPQGGLGCQ